MDRPTLSGACHCGAIKIELRLSWSPENAPVRACDCRFCRAHGARTVSDPDGRVEISLPDSAKVRRYRFGLRTADYLICRECGVYVAAVIDAEDEARATVNVNVLDDRTSFDARPPLVNYDAETAAQRRARRRARWTPAAIGSANPV